jgi:hypothetical protein
MRTTIPFNAGGNAKVYLSSEEKSIRGFPPGTVIIHPTAGVTSMKYSSNVDMPPILLGIFDTGGRTAQLDVEVETEEDVNVYLHHCGSVGCDDTWVPFIGNVSPRSGSFMIEQHLCGKGWRLRNFGASSHETPYNPEIIIHGEMSVYINEKLHYSIGPGLTKLFNGPYNEANFCPEGYNCVYNAEFIIPCKIKIEFSGSYCGISSIYENPIQYLYAGWPEQ